MRREPEMTSKEKSPIRATGLSLEPLEGEASPDAPAYTGTAKFTANTRGKSDRRKVSERRDVIRFEEDRRSSPDRRPRKSWESGKNL
jgi:hypothetical protein